MQWAAPTRRWVRNPAMRWEGANEHGAPLPFEVMALSEFLGREVAAGRIKVKKIGQTTTFHDPCQIIRKTFDLTPKGIIDSLNLRRPVFKETARYGHFGRNHPDYTWEKTDKADALRSAAGLS